MKRFLDPGAVFAGWVGVGMAATIVISFMLVIAIEPVAWFLSLPAGMLIGYYANSRSERVSGWGRMLANSLYAGAMTGLTLALLVLAFKALFFFADDGYRPAALGGPLACDRGAACVYARYQASEPDQLRANGVTSTDGFTALYWREELTTTAILGLATVGGGLLGGALYGATRSRRREAGTTAGATAP